MDTVSQKEQKEKTYHCKHRFLVLTSESLGPAGLLVGAGVPVGGPQAWLTLSPGHSLLPSAALLRLVHEVDSGGSC